MTAKNGREWRLDMQTIACHEEVPRINGTEATPAECIFLKTGEKLGPEV